MSEREQRFFYGEERVPLIAVLMNLYKLTGSEACASELVEAADYVERVCGPTAALTAMPEWVQ